MMALADVELKRSFPSQTTTFIIEVYASYMMALAGVELETLVSEPDALDFWFLLVQWCTWPDFRATIYNLGEIFYLWHLHQIFI